MSNSLRLGFHYHTPAQPRDGGIYIPGYLGRFVDGLAAYCEQVICFLHTPKPEEVSLMDYRIQSPNVRLVDIGPHASMPIRTLLAHRATGPIGEHRKDLDAMLIRGPTPLLPFVARTAGSIPVALLIVGDYVKAAKESPQPWWRKTLIQLWAHWTKWAQMRVARRSLTFVNSHQLYEELEPRIPRLVETRTTTLSEDDFFEREDTCQSPPYHLLYTGRLVRSKGLLDMVEALRLLVQQDEDVVLDLVGWFSEDASLWDEMQAVAEQKGVRDRVTYHGYKTVGSELFQVYKEADLFLVASYASEGFPRVIWEAMAHSLPVVATRVGSIPAFVEDAAMLIEPSNPKILAKAIRRMLQESSLRQRMIRQGLALARQNTLEARSKEMIDRIRREVGECS